MVGMITYERSTLNEQRKVYWARRSSSNDLSSGDGFPRQGCDGIHPGNQSLYASGVLRGIERQPVRDVWRKAPGQPGSTTCSSRMLPRFWSAIRARSHCSNRATRVTRSMLANWPSGCASMISSPCTTAKPGYACCASWPEVISPWSKIYPES